MEFGAKLKMQNLKLQQKLKIGLKDNLKNVININL